MPNFEVSPEAKKKSPLKPERAPWKTALGLAAALVTGGGAAVGAGVGAGALLGKSAEHQSDRTESTAPETHQPTLRELLSREHLDRDELGEIGNLIIKEWINSGEIRRFNGDNLALQAEIESRVYAVRSPDHKHEEVYSILVGTNRALDQAKREAMGRNDMPTYQALDDLHIPLAGE